MYCRKLILLCSILSFLCFKAYSQAPSCSAASKFYSKDSINVTTFGASTVAGVGGFSFQGYLKQNFENCYVGKVVTVTTNGVPGQTTTQGLPRFADAIAGRTGFILILMGANDAQSLAKKTMTIAETEKNMKYYIDESLKHHLIPVIGTIQFYNDQNNQFYKTCNLYIKQINAIYKQLVKENHIYLADINKVLGRDFSLYQDDVHPNAMGYRLISYVWFDAVNRAIEDKLLLIGLNQNYPNPVNDFTKIGFSLSQPGLVKITLYNISGASMKTIVDSYQNSGYHEINVSLSGITRGVYIYVMQVGGQQISKKLIVMR